MGNNRRRRGKKGKKQESKTEAKNDVGKADSSSSASWKDRGTQAFSKGDYDGALECFSKGIEEDEKNLVLISNRSFTYTKLEKWDKALEDAEKCIELDPKWTKGYYRKGKALMGLYRYKDAYAVYKAGLALDANDKLISPAMKQLESLLQELKITEAQLTTGGDNPDRDVFEDMVQWLRKGGAEFPMLYLQYYSEDYRGVHCLTKIPSDTRILYVPHSHIMTSEVAKASSIGRKIIEAAVDLHSKHSYLAAYLCHEKHNPDSFWRPYIRILPTKYRNMPIFFTEHELKYLAGSFVLDKIRDRYKSLVAEYERICKGVPEFRKYTAHEFIWARLAVITRIFGLMIKNNKTDGLVPYADMLNHKQPRETTWTFSDDVDGFTITSVKGINRGDEVFDSYGRKCNSRFFVNYGFTLDKNPDNEVVIKLTIPKMVTHYDMKIRMLGGPDAANREFQVPCNYREKKTKGMFAFLRFAHAKDEEMTMLPPDSNKLEEIEPLSIRNEIAVLKQIAVSAKAVLSRFPTSWEEDKKLLKLPRDKLREELKEPDDEDHNIINIRSCIVMRAGEKEVLHFYMDLAEKAIPMLGKPWKDLKKIVAKCNRQHPSDFDKYVTDVVAPLVKNQK